MSQHTAAVPSDADADVLALAAHPYRPDARFGLAVLAAAVALTVTWFAWAAVARHRLRQQVDAIATRGEPTRPDAFPSPTVADADNAAVAWRSAMAAVSTTVDCPSASASLYYRPYPDYPPGWWTAARASEAANAAVFPLADAAAAHGVARWIDGPTAATSDPMAFVPYNGARAVTGVLADSALLAHFGDGDDARCLGRLADALALADAVDQQPSLITHLAACGCRATVVNRVLVVAPDLDVGPPAGGQRQRVRAMVGQLLRTADASDRITPVLADQAVEADAWSRLRLAPPALGPLWDLAGSRALRLRATDVRAARAADAEAADAVYAATPDPPRPSFAAMGTDHGSSGYPFVDASIRAYARAAAVALCLRMYRADHGAAWPADLATQVPADCPAVPADVAAAGSPPVGFVIRPHGRPDGRDRPMLLIGRRSSAAQAVGPSAEPSFDVARRGQTTWMDLTRWPLPPPVPPPPGAIPGMPSMPP